MAYWACVQTAPQREWVAQHFLELSEFEVYFPRVLERRIIRARRTDIVRPLFPVTCSHGSSCNGRGRAARSASPGSFSMVSVRPSFPMPSSTPAGPSERGGCVQLPKRPRWRPGDRV